MGLLRLILALSVVAGHGDFWRPFFLINASAAVVCFFVVSGFYMALVLNEKYISNARFAKARAIRLLPAYYFFLAIELAFWVHDGQHFDPLATVLAVILFGRDYFYISTFPPGASMLLGQTWSVAVELQFYAIAAFAFRTPRGIIVVFIGGLALRVLMQALGYVYSPIGTWLTLNSLVFFGAGGVAYLLFKRIENRALIERAAFAGLISAGILAYLRHFDGLRWIDANTTEPRFYPLYLGIAVVVPFLFSITKESATDKVMGELSYPVYLSHIMAYDVAHRLQQGAPFVLALTAAASVFALLMVERPLQRLFSKAPPSCPYRAAIVPKPLGHLPPPGHSR